MLADSDMLFFLGADSQFDYFVDRAKNNKSSSSSDGVAVLFNQIESIVTEEMVGDVKAVFKFQLSGSDEGNWLVDLKNGAGMSLKLV